MVFRSYEEEERMKERLTYEFYEGLPAEARAIRQEVFVEEQGFENEFDEWDEQVPELVLFVDGEPAGTGRILPGEETGVYMAGRIAVRKAYRGLHLGSRILALLEERARAMGGDRMQLSAQCQARGFYEKQGYQASGEIYMDEHCPHVHMEKRLTKR